MEQQLNQLTFQEVTLRKELSSLGKAVNINALEDWESKVLEFLADLKAGVDELKTVTPQTPEELHEVFLVKKRVVDTLVERIQIDRERNLQVQIRLNLLEIIGKEAQDYSIAAVQFHEDGICNRIQSTQLRPIAISYANPNLRNSFTTSIAHILFKNPYDRRPCYLINARTHLVTLLVNSPQPLPIHHDLGWTWGQHGCLWCVRGEDVGPYIRSQDCRR